MNPLALTVLILAFLILAFIGAWGISTFTREWRRNRERTDRSGEL